MRTRPKGEARSCAKSPLLGGRIIKCHPACRQKSERTTCLSNKTMSTCLFNHNLASTKSTEFLHSASEAWERFEIAKQVQSASLGMKGPKVPF
eukprot:1161712-Pelagomonas_calceolata.AAC.13